MAKRVLVADDSLLIRKMLCEFFEREDEYDICAEAKNGQEAIDLAVRHRPDLIILDWAMPVLGGFGFRDGCDAVLDGYLESLKMGGCPFVLAEHQRNLERLGIEAIKPPQGFWETLTKNPSVPRRNVPLEAREAWRKTLPPAADYKVVRRVAGMGSLGQRRFVAIVMHEGGYLAREAKATIPSASVWKEGKKGRGEHYYEKTISSAVRSHDPFQLVVGNWLIRRLSPDSNPIEIDKLPKERDEYALLSAMGREVANVHLGTNNQAKRVLRDLSLKKPNWLRRAGKKMAKAIEKDWREYIGSSPLHSKWAMR